MHARISVSAICTNRWSVAEDLAFWTRAGITNVGLALRKLEATGLDKAVHDVGAAGLTVTNLLGLGFRLDQSDDWKAHQARLVRAVEAAATLRAGCFVLTTGRATGLAWEEAADALARALAPIKEACSALGVPLAIEHTNSLRVDVSFLHTLRDAVDLARSLGVGVVMESNACWAERGLAHTIKEAAGDLALVQISDFVVGTLSTPDRAVPGDGHIPLRRILGGVLDAGYSGVFDLELIGPRIEAEGYERALARAIEATELLLTELGATR